MRSWLKAPTFSPKGFVVRASLLALLYLVLSLSGFRHSMSVLSLTFPEGSSRGWSVVACMTYLVSYFLWILAVPVLLLAAGLMELVGRVRAGTIAASRPEGPRPP